MNRRFVTVGDDLLLPEPIRTQLQGAQGEPGTPGAPGSPGDPGAQGIPGDPTAFELRGTGFPEGVVTASVGTYYTDTAATNGAIRWVKASGTGNTGWRVVYGDTGWRNIEADIQAECTRVGATYSRMAGFGAPQIRMFPDMIVFDVAFNMTGTITGNDFKTALRQINTDTAWCAGYGNRQIPAVQTGSAGVIHWSPKIYVSVWTAGAVFIPRTFDRQNPGTWPSTLPGTPA